MFDFKEITGPYPGLRPFESHEAEIFFGREAHTDRLLEILQREHFLAVIGPSGSGKSSLVRAGLLPALAAGWLGTGSSWRIATLRPGDHPIRGLAQALLQPAALGAELVSNAEGDVHESLPSIEAELNRGPLGLIHLADDALARTDASAPFNLLVLVDQFEELFRFSDAGVSQNDESNAFVNLLLTPRTMPTCPIYVVLTMRTDFLGHCVRFLDLPEAINQSQYLTPRLSRSQIESAISGPARVCGGEVDPRLVNELINGLGCDQDQLPILQHALARMWSEASEHESDSPFLTLDTFYRACGLTSEDTPWLADAGFIGQALSRHADAILNSLSIDDQIAAEQVFRCITERTLLGSRDIRRPQRLQRIAEFGGLPWESYLSAIRAFSRPGAHLLSHAEPLDQDAFVDISHEALIRLWDKLQHWVTDEAERAAVYRRWRDRACGGSEALTGADLARAVEWRNGRDNWKPTAGWSRRYAMANDQADQEFAETIAFIDHSQAHATSLAKAEEARRKRQLRQLEREKQRAEEQARLALAGKLVFAAEREKATRIDRAMLLAVEAVSATREPLPEAQSALLSTLLAYPELRCIFQAHSGPVYSVAFSPDGRYLASAGSDKTVWLYRAAAGTSDTNDSTEFFASDSLIEPIRLGTSRSEIITLAFSPDSSLLASGNAGGSVQLWNPATGTALDTPLRSQYNSFTCTAFTPDGKVLAASAVDGAIRLWNLADRRLLSLIKGHKRGVLSVAFSPNGKYLASSSKDGTVRIWDWKRKRMLMSIKGHKGYVWKVVYSPDGNLLATAGSDKTVRLWHAITGQLDATTGEPALPPMTGHTDEVYAVTFSPDGRVLASSSLDGTVRMWDPATGQPIREPLKSHGGWIYNIAFSPDSKLLATADWDNRVRLWDVRSPNPLILAQREIGAPAYAAAFSPSGDWLATSEPGAAFVRLDEHSLTPMTEPTGTQSEPLVAIAIAPDGKHIATAGRDQAVQLWIQKKGKFVATTLQGHQDSVNSLAFSADGKLLASASTDSSVRLWDTKTGSPVGTPLLGQIGWVYAVCFHPEGRHLACGGQDNVIRLWDLQTRQPQTRPLRGHKDAVVSLAYSPDGKRIASASLDGTVRLWSATNGQALGEPLTGHDGRVWSVAFSPDGKRLASAGLDGTVRLWDAIGFQQIGEPLLGHSGIVWMVLFSPDGRRLLSTGDDGTLRLWDVDPLSWMRRARAIANRTLTRDEVRKYLGEIAEWR